MKTNLSENNFNKNQIVNKIGSSLFIISEALGFPNS